MCHSPAVMLSRQLIHCSPGRRTKQIQQVDHALLVLAGLDLTIGVGQCAFGSLPGLRCGIAQPHHASVSLDGLGNGVRARVFHGTGVVAAGQLRTGKSPPSSGPGVGCLWVEFRRICIFPYPLWLLRHAGLCVLLY